MLHFGGPWLDRDGIIDDNNDEVDEDVEVKLKKQWTVGDGGNNVDTRNCDKIPESSQGAPR